jgi:hypothetical protein
MPRKEGSPAIVPHLNEMNPNLPDYTAEDAKAYAQRVAPLQGGCLTPWSVANVQFMTDAEVTQQFQADPGLAASALLCVVEVHGRFNTAESYSAEPRIFTTLYEIFDARTGNLLQLYAPESALEP